MDWRGKTVLITGGTGSFGQAFTRHLLATEDIAAVRILSRDEFKQAEMQRTLPDERLRFLIGDVRDRERLLRAFADVDVVIHAAAMKQVPLCEYNPLEAVRTNVLGAANVIDAAIERGVQRTLAISTDKAANPVNLYGATKLCAEKLIVQGNAYTGKHPTRFSCVRYGNVAASRGSIVPLLYQQRADGRVTLTDPRMTRFWITLEQAAQLVKRCVETMHGGEVFIPKLPSIRVVDLIAAIAPNCEVETIGVRPGEKLHELLLTEEDARHSIDAGEHFIIQPQHPWWSGAAHRGTTLAEGFVYSSDRNDRWLGMPEIAAALPSALQDAMYAYSTAEESPGA